jgi:hypothetical protein
MDARPLQTACSFIETGREARMADDCESNTDSERDVHHEQPSSFNAVHSGRSVERM